ncbi:DNA polymerase III subunit delta [Pararhizobium antarcticum]|uniref:DNA polymerase III subunit delta n=1 Tax=Pararhizobium antarcticum TaxID=1798805 RepID=A0A657LMP8_9HYPH|nr:DNA polymerase III subunit delta [Pararhizobium antarcticum]OJF91209.1 DNA polymerase III subunit delta [Pararhizobium antarcticum]OJG01117.1 DNA polymerase III subunit delta [Rhizobium sp. 58]
MTEVKSHEFDSFLQRSIKDSRLYLIYGPDRGLVSERASMIAAKTGVALDDPFSLIKLDGSDLQQSPGRLLDEVNAFGLFGGEKLVWIRSAGSEKALVDGFQLLAQEPPTGSYVIIEAGDLKKGTGLRKIGESSRAVISVACYADDARAVSALIDQELAQVNLKITPAARERLQEALGGDRIASRNEIRKLALYCRGMGTIEEEHVQDIVGDASAISVDDAIDAVLKGDADGLVHAIQKIVTSKTPIFLVLQGCLKQFQLLDLMRAEMDAKRLQPAQVTATLGRHLHFRRKPIVESALKTWSGPAIQRELGRLQATIFQSRSRQSLEESAAMQALLAITLQSARR